MKAVVYNLRVENVIFTKDWNDLCTHLGYWIFNNEKYITALLYIRKKKHKRIISSVYFE